jgi:uncharacterized protein (DUF1778 family)
MILSHRDQEIFLSALLNPPEANNQLKNALMAHNNLGDSDV